MKLPWCRDTHARLLLLPAPTNTTYTLTKSGGFFPHSVRVLVLRGVGCEVGLFVLMSFCASAPFPKRAAMGAMSKDAFMILFRIFFSSPGSPISRSLPDSSQTKSIPHRHHHHHPPQHVLPTRSTAGSHPRGQGRRGLRKSQIAVFFTLETQPRGTRQMGHAPDPI